jgi:hypothetical protein
MIHVGDVIKRRIQIFDPQHDNRTGKPAERIVEATVVYIHPENGWMTLEFNLPGGNYRESEFLR